MDSRTEGNSAVTGRPVTITNHGGIVQMTVPEGFEPVKLSPDKSRHNYLEFNLPRTSTRVCYEEMQKDIGNKNREEMSKLFSEQLPEGIVSRYLNLFGDDDCGPDDSAIYNALCQCFVFGGNLVRQGARMDVDDSEWELRKLGNAPGFENVLIARLYFFDHKGSRDSRREALLAIPTAPSPERCGYLWLEGTAADVDTHGPAFLKAVANGTFKS